MLIMPGEEGAEKRRGDGLGTEMERGRGLAEGGGHWTLTARGTEVGSLPKVMCQMKADMPYAPHVSDGYGRLSFISFLMRC